MAVEEFPIVCWRLDEEKIMGKVLGADLTIIESSSKKIRKSAAEYLAKLEQAGEYLYPPEMDETTIHHYKIEVQLGYREDNGVFPLADKTTFRVTAVHGESEEQGFGECYLPFLDEEFYYYNPNQRRALIEHYTRESLQHMTPEAAYQYIMPSDPWLESVRMAVKKKSRSVDAKKDPEILLAVADKMPLPKKAMRKISRMPEVTWERNSEIHLLGKKLLQERNNILLVGAQGVGKTVLWQEAVKWMHRVDIKDFPEGTEASHVWRSTCQRLISKAKYLGEWQAVCDEVVSALSASQGILWVTDFISLLNSGGESQEDSVAAYLQAYLQRGDLRLIGELKPQELEVARGLLPGFIHLFEIIKVPELTKTASRRVLDQYGNYASQNFGFSFERTALDLSFQLVNRYVKYEKNPGRQVRFIGECIKNKMREDTKHIDRSYVIEQFNRYTGLPEKLLRDDIALPRAELEDFFSAKIVGQDSAVRSIASVVQMFKAGLNDPNKPIATMLFAGPTGVGKTAATKALAEFFFSMGQNRNPLFSVDMSEFQHPIQVSRLIGDKQKTGKLVEHVRSQPFSVILLDEVEKAHPSVFDMLLTVLDEGLLTDRFGRVTDFRSSVIILTTNLGVESGRALGFSRSDSEGVSISSIKKHFRPEFFNRIDHVVVFNSLEKDAVHAIVRRELGLLEKRDSLATESIKLRFDEDVIDYISRVGFSAKYGARPIQRAIEKYIVAAIARLLLNRDKALEKQKLSEIRLSIEESSADGEIIIANPVYVS